jgi:hypothetical protein
MSSVDAKLQTGLFTPHRKASIGPIGRLERSGFRVRGLRARTPSGRTWTVQGSTALPVSFYTGPVYAAGAVTGPIWDYLPSQLWTALGLDEVFAAGHNGAGQIAHLVGLGNSNGGTRPSRPMGGRFLPHRRGDEGPQSGFSSAAGAHAEGANR